MIFKHLLDFVSSRKFGDSITTDHISPAGAIGKDTPAGKYLTENGVEIRVTSTHTVHVVVTMK